MKNITKTFFVTFLAVVISSCGGAENSEPVVELKTSKDKLSYAMGAEHAGQLMNSPDPNVQKYDKEAIYKGFEIGLTNEEAFDEACQKSIVNLLGQDQRQFNQEYKSEGSLSIGKLLGSVFLKQMNEGKIQSKLDIEKVKIGFSQALYGSDTLIEKSARTKIVQDFIAGINQKKMEQVIQQEKPFFAKVAAMKGIQVLPEGMYLETVKAGKGGKPATGDDVLVDYILTNIKNDTIESSFEAKKQGQQMPAFSLNGVIKGWGIGVPFMNKGGAYRLYVPTALAYGKEPLVFYIELQDFGKPGTLVKPAAPQMGF